MFKNNIHISSVLLFIIIFFLTIFSGEVNDYRLYLKMWEVSNSGASPWATEFNGVSIRNSSYGPLHSVIGLFAKISSIFPKILFAISGFIIFLILVNAKKAHTKNFKTKDLLLVLLIYPLFPLTIITSYIYGINDSIVALIVIMACESRYKKI